MDFKKLGKLINKKEIETNAVPRSILNNLLHNVDKVHEEKYKNAGRMLRNALIKYNIDFEVPEDDIKVDWNKIMQGYHEQG